MLSGVLPLCLSDPDADVCMFIIRREAHGNPAEESAACSDGRAVTSYVPTATWVAALRTLLPGYGR